MSENTKKSHTVSNEELSRQKQFTQKVSSVISASYDEKPKACVITYSKMLPTVKKSRVCLNLWDMISLMTGLKQSL